MDNLIVAAVIIVIIVVIFYAISSYFRKPDGDYISGVWTAHDDTFCRDADINSMMMYIGQDVGGERSSYLLITDDVTSQNITIKYKSMKKTCDGKFEILATVTFTDEQVWDEDVLMKIDMMTGIMKIFSRDGGKLFARLYKDNEMSDMVRD